ncbi:hypothetical protein PACTADRAFT_51519 [Pachysolen tannophilus NRRL Y-2460]|uniref:tRNA-binding domain-containing protein n=1 Tax=Pachysolen tannophilus NRRL Y-2460 TaxID=669874 RepID=A0A1E4TPS8_PACTA|nr:hypothetical protein PACTADRAFT_51519 [Pachysolen tannophilus NRRL Y-2460]
MMIIVSPSLLKLTVGKIIDIQKHENADKIYVSKILIQDQKIDQEIKINQSMKAALQVCSGLVPYIPMSELLNSRVVVVTNLKPSKIRGVLSEAMILAAENSNNLEDEDVSQQQLKVEVVRPPISSNIGDRLFFESHIIDHDKEAGRVKPKVWQEIAKHLRTNENCQVVYKLPEGGENLLKLNKSNDNENVNENCCYVKSLSNAIVR